MTDLEQIIKSSEKLIYSIASKFYNVPQEELYQAGVLGIIKAYKNYKNDGNTKFSTYAYNYIFGEMYELANGQRQIKLNKDILKLYRKIEETKYKLCQKLNYIPSTSEISLYLNIDENIINDIYNCTNSIMSFDDEEKKLYEIIPNQLPDSKDNIIDIKASLDTLTDQERQIINYRYFKDFTQSETANILGLSQVKVSRYEKKSLNKMYNYLTS